MLPVALSPSPYLLSFSPSWFFSHSFTKFFLPLHSLWRPTLSFCWIGRLWIEQCCRGGCFHSALYQSQLCVLNTALRTEKRKKKTIQGSLLCLLQIEVRKQLRWLLGGLQEKAETPYTVRRTGRRPGLMLQVRHHRFVLRGWNRSENVCPVSPGLILIPLYFFWQWLKGEDPRYKLSKLISRLRSVEAPQGTQPQDLQQYNWNLPGPNEKEENSISENNYFCLMLKGSTWTESPEKMQNRPRAHKRVSYPNLSWWHGLKYCLASLLSCIQIKHKVLEAAGL